MKFVHATAGAVMLTFRLRRRSSAAAILALAMAGSAGCAALTNPVAQGIPVRELPDEALGESREALRPVPLNLLGQEEPEVYRLAAGDILSVAIQNILDEKNAPLTPFDADGGPPALGYSIPVREDGTIILPSVDPIKVAGLSVTEVYEKVRAAYTVDKEILNKDKARIVVSLYRPRRHRVRVVREDGGSSGVQTSAVSVTGFSGATVGASHKGTGVVLDLPVYESDVLNALTRSGGLPGTDAKNEVVVQRKPRRGDPPGAPVQIRIPLRLRPGEPVPFGPEDVILHPGDTVFVESRQAEVFYTAGLLGAGQFPLPRDTDLDVLQAIAIIRGPLVNGGFSQNIGGTSVSSGIGNPSPSLVTVLRKTVPGRQLPIRVDLNLAFQDPRERLRIQPGDIIVLQETAEEALTRYFTNVFQLTFSGSILNRTNAQAGVTAAVP